MSRAQVDPRVVRSFPRVAELGVAYYAATRTRRRLGIQISLACHVHADRTDLVLLSAVSIQPEFLQQRLVSANPQDDPGPERNGSRPAISMVQVPVAPGRGRPRPAWVDLQQDDYATCAAHTYDLQAQSDLHGPPPPLHRERCLSPGDAAEVIGVNASGLITNSQPPRPRT